MMNLTKQTTWGAIVALGHHGWNTMVVMWFSNGDLHFVMFQTKPSFPLNYNNSCIPRKWIYIKTG